MIWGSSGCLKHRCGFLFAVIMFCCFVCSIYFLAEGLFHLYFPNWDHCILSPHSFCLKLLAEFTCSKLLIYIYWILVSWSLKQEKIIGILKFWSITKNIVKKNMVGFNLCWGDWSHPSSAWFILIYSKAASRKSCSNVSTTQWPELSTRWGDLLNICKLEMKEKKNSANKPDIYSRRAANGSRKRKYDYLWSSSLMAAHLFST